MADPKKNPLIGAFRSPVPGPVPSDPAEKDPKLANQPPAAAPKAVQTAGTAAPVKPGEAPGNGPPKEKANGNAPASPTDGKKPEEPPKSMDPKSKTDGAAPAAPTDGKKPQEPPKAADPKGKTDGATPAAPTDGKKPEEPPKATDPKGKTGGTTPTAPTDGKKPEEPPKDADPKGKTGGTTPAAPTDGKKPEEPPKAADPKGKADGTTPAAPTDGKKPEEPPKAADPKGKTDGTTPAAPADGKKPEEPPKAADPKDKTDNAAPAAQQGASTPAQEDEIPPDFSLNIVPSSKLGTVTMMPIDLIDDFEGHPFEVRDDKDMEELVASIKQVGLLEPATIIPNEKKVGRFEMVAGHRRKHAAKLAGLTHIPVIVRDMDHDEATIYMVDSNLKREKLTPMEKARAYTMKTEALRRKMGRKSKEEIAALEAQGKKPLTADQELAAQTGESVATVQRFKTLTKLTPPLQKMVDKGTIPVNTAADIAQMKPAEQNALADAIEKEVKVPSGTAAKELKEASRAGTLTTEKIQAAVAPTKREESPPLKVTLGEEDLRPYFPDKRTTVPDVKQAIFEGLSLRNKMIEHQKAKAKAEKSVKKKPVGIER